MLFSIVVPVYNVEKYLTKCLDSIAAQTFRDFEVIIVDDGSKDSCPETADAYAAGQGNFRVIHQENQGLVGARNTGLLAASGDYVTFLDSDDWADPSMLSFVAGKLEEFPEKPDMVMFAAYEVHKDHMGETINRVPEAYYDRTRLEKEIFPYLFSDRRNGFRSNSKIHAHTWDKFCRREILLSHYCRETRIRMFTDVPLTFECLLYCSSAYICNEHLYYYNKLNESSIRAKGGANYVSENFVILNKYLRERLQGYSADIDRQLNDYPAVLLIAEITAALNNGISVRDEAGKLRKKLNETGFLKLIDAGGLPPKPRLIVSLLKMHMDLAAVALTDLNRRKNQPRGQG